MAEPKSRAVPIHLRAPPDLLAKIDEAAARRKTTRTRVIWDAARRQLEAPAPPVDDTP